MSANVVSAQSKQPIFKPWVVLNKTFKATDAGGKAVDVTLKVGVIGFAPPPILQWDKANLEGHVEVTGWKETAARYVPEMKAAGADLIVALAHGGIDLKTPYSASMENGAAYLTQVPGIDALITGHQHLLFPDTNPKSQFAGQPGIDLAKGLINGVPAVQAGQWGNNLGQIKLRLAYDKGWSVQKDATQVQRISTRLTAQSGNTPATYVAPDAATQQLVQVEHAATIAYVKTPIGAAQFDMSTYYAMAGDVSALQIVNMAQIDYLKDYIARNNPSYAALPILSAAAPFWAGAMVPATSPSSSRATSRSTTRPTCTCIPTRCRWCASAATSCASGWKRRPSSSGASTPPKSRRRIWSTRPSRPSTSTCCMPRAMRCATR